MFCRTVLFRFRLCPQRAVYLSALSEISAVYGAAHHRLGIVHGVQCLAALLCHNAGFIGLSVSDAVCKRHLISARSHTRL